MSGGGGVFSSLRRACRTKAARRQLPELKRAFAAAGATTGAAAAAAVASAAFAGAGAANYHRQDRHLDIKVRCTLQ